MSNPKSLVLEWQRRASDYEATIADLRSQLDRRSAEAEALKRSATQIEDLKTKLETARAQLEAAQRTIASLEQDDRGHWEARNLAQKGINELLGQLEAAHREQIGRAS